MASRSSMLLVPALALGCFDPEPPTMDIFTSAPASTGDETGSPPDTAEGTTADDETVGDDTIGMESGPTGPGESSSDGGPTTGDPACGNGTVEGSEECDLGAANSDNAACTSECRLATCGDGLVHLDEEECDDAGESAACDDDCTAAACGDGLLNVTAGEQCEGGPIANGSCDGSCMVVCNAGFGDCNGMPGDGCEGDVSQEAGCIACGLAWQTVTLDGIDDVSISGSLKGPEGRIAAYTNFPSGSGSVVGYIGFDTSGISDSATIVGGRLFLHHEVGFGNPYQNPEVQLVQADANNWSFPAINPGDITPGPVISGTWSSFSIDAYNEFAFDPSTWDYSVDLADDWMTLGIDETGVDYHYVYFYGTDFPGIAPYVELDLCQ